LMQMQGIHPSSELESLIVIVEIVLELSRQQDCRQHHFMRVQTIETEVRLTHIVSISSQQYLRIKMEVPVDVDDGYDQALGRELRVLVQSSQEVEEGDRRRRGGVEEGVTGAALLLDQVLQQIRREDHQLLRTHLYR
jgi:hypothetical protein